MSRMRRGTRIISALFVVALLAAACGGDGGSGGGPSGDDNRDVAEAEIPKGGTLRIAGTSDIDFMDPAASYYTLGAFLYRGVLRQLVTFPADNDREVAHQLVPDLATSTGEASDDGLTYTFTLKDGIKYGPALGGEDVPGVTGEEITSHDMKYGIERIFIPAVGGGYPFYYLVIEGAQEFADGDADEITGIETPDDKTIVFRLTKPVGDFPLRLSMPAASPVPQEYAEQWDKDQDSNYDSHVVASGPYYISEWTPEEQISLERNEFWDESTDDVRKAYVDAVDWKLGFDNDVGVQKVFDSEYDLGLDVNPQGPSLERVLSDPELKERFVNEVDPCTRFIFMNTQVEPFDNPLVREAVEFAIDRANIKTLFGGPITGPIATSIIPQNLPGGLPSDEFNPFASPNMAGDMEKAKALMAEAGYPDGFDEEVLVVGASDPPHDQIAESIRVDLEELGFSNLNVKTPAYPNQYTQYYQIPSKDVGIGTSAGWCSDFPDASTFIEPLFNGDNISDSSNQNYSLIDDPDINAAIQEALEIPLGPERDAAWEEINRQLTEMALWIPWSWDSSKIVYGEDLVNIVYNDTFAQIDWVVAGVNHD